jgi:pyruvate dehydrogenase E2 component (dihydrolipoamide acetyltransferase)
MSGVPMPRLSDSMEEGTIIRWLASEGASIERGQELVEIETDKASMTYEADDAGTLHILAQEGDTLPVGAPIAELLAAGESPQQSASAPQPPAQSPPPAATVPPAPVTEEPAPAAEPLAEAERPERIKASPLARRRAASEGLDLASVSGSGPGGRIVRADVEQAVADPARGEPQSPVQAKGHSEILELTRTQALIARRMAEAKATIPEFMLQAVIDMDAAVALRAQLKSLAELEQRPVPSFNDLVVRACALALREHPRANSSYRDGRLELHGRVNVGVAVALDDALVVPVIHDADERSLWEIAARTRELAARARAGTITPPELAGGTFSVSNLGMYGVDSFTAVINPPQAAILAVGSLAERAVVNDGQLLALHTMTVTLSCDHRIRYGAQAAQFLQSIRARLEAPIALLA